MKGIGISERNDWEKFATLEAMYSLADRALEHELVPACLDQGLAILVFSPLHAGLLSGKYRRNAPWPTGTRVTSTDEGQWPFEPEHLFNIVDVMAEIRLNGRDLGILWKTPYRVDVTEALKPGDNALEIKVVNLWINRQIGDEHLPDDSPRTGRGAEWAAPGTTLTAWPQWLLDGKPSPTGRYTFTSWRLWTKDDPLAPSGLLGPVRFEAAKSLRFSAHKE